MMASSTTNMVGSQKFRDLQVFPLDPTDYALLQERARDDGVNIYLRLFFDGKYRTIVLIEHPRNLARIWRTFVHERRMITMEENLESTMVYRVYDAFVEHPSAENIDAAELSVKILCLLHRPALRRLTKAPRDNIVGTIFEFKQRVFTDFCYCQFALEDIPALTAIRH
jgi:hypothetical protein